MSRVHIRPARPFDAGPMVRLLHGLSPVTTPTDRLSVEDLQDWLAQSAAWHLAENAGEVLGFQWIESHPDLPPTTCDIATFVGDDNKGIDVETRLFEVTRKAAKVAGFTHIRAKIRATNDSGLIYYQSRGFERLTPRDDPTSGRPPVKYVLMSYRL